MYEAPAYAPAYVICGAAPAYVICGATVSTVGTAPAYVICGATVSMLGGAGMYEADDAMTVGAGPVANVSNTVACGAA
jgi:hypothetical protein